MVHNDRLSLDSRRIGDHVSRSRLDGLRHLPLRASHQTSLISGDIVEMRDFGVLRVRTRASRKARNPRTGEKVVVDKKKMPYFK